MNPKDQKTSVVLEKIYSLLINAKTKKETITYSECFNKVFDIPYSNREFLQFITERNVINNIPMILGEISFECKESEWPPLPCLVVSKADGKTGKGVVTSKEVAAEERPDFAMQTDLPAVYGWQAYPQPDSQEAKAFLSRVMDRLRKKKLVRED